MPTPTCLSSQLYKNIIKYIFYNSDITISILEEREREEKLQVALIEVQNRSDIQSTLQQLRTSTDINKVGIKEILLKL